MSNYLKRIFAIMFGAVGLTAITSYATLMWGQNLIFKISGEYISSSPLVLVMGMVGLGVAIFAQARAFSMKPSSALVFLGIYSIIMGFTITPLVAISLAVNPASILQAFCIAAIMFACMALFGYKTVKDLSFLGTFLFIGMVGLILVGLASWIWPLGSTFATIVSAVGVLVFALFTAYDMQFLKNAFAQVNEKQAGQLAVLGALHLYISFIAMFQYVLSLLNRR